MKMKAAEKCNETEKHSKQTVFIQRFPNLDYMYDPVEAKQIGERRRSRHSTGISNMSVLHSTHLQGEALVSCASFRSQNPDRMLQYQEMGG